MTEVYDARELATATWSFTYDLAGRRLTSNHSTALGARYALADAAGNPIWARDARGIEVDRVFDALNRPLTEHSDDGSTVKLRRAWTYIAYDTVTDSNNDDARGKNLFGQVEEERDADGLRFFEYDWRGQVTKASHKFWSTNPGTTGENWTNTSSSFWTTDWDPEVDDTARGSLSTDDFLALDDLTDTETMVVTSTYDVAGRPTTMTYPESLSTTTSYNAAGMLDSVSVTTGVSGHWAETAQDVVSDCVYDKRGKLDSCTHGNGIVTTREYDDDLERLTRIFSQYVNGSTTSFQDLNYLYDPVGNPVRITDALQEDQYAHNQVIPNTRQFSYDPRYRLTRARGKMLRSIAPGSINPEEASPQDNDYVAYDLRYRYDEVGNFLRNQEFAQGPLHYKDDGTGRIDLFNGRGAEADDADPTSGNYTYDANGNNLSNPRQQELTYTFDNQPRYVDMGGGTEVRYLRHGDQRVARFLKKSGVEAVGIYLGPFEYHTRTGVNARTKVVLHVSGPGSRAQIEVVLDGTDGQSLDVFFSHTDHLGSGHVLTKDDATLLSQEEYFPYGRASDRRDTRNRYRYIGVERDEETGLLMTGPRTYDPVTGRFLSGDPIRKAGQSPFVYSSGNPVRRQDSSGYDDKEAVKSTYQQAQDAHEQSLPESNEAARARAAAYYEGLQGGEARPKRPEEILAEKVSVTGGSGSSATVDEEGFIESLDFISPVAEAVEDAGTPAFQGADYYVDKVKERVGNWVGTVMGLAGTGVGGGGTRVGVTGSSLSTRGGSVGVLRSSNRFMGIEPASDDLLRAVGSRRSVNFAAPGSEEMRYLEYIGAEANVGGEDMMHILLRANPSKAAVLEEFLHGTQHRLGIIDSLGTAGAETHVKDFMIRHQRMLGLSNEDVQILQQLKDAGL